MAGWTVFHPHYSKQLLAVSFPCYLQLEANSLIPYLVTSHHNYLDPAMLDGCVLSPSFGSLSGFIVH